MPTRATPRTHLTGTIAGTVTNEVAWSDPAAGEGLGMWLVRAWPETGQGMAAEMACCCRCAPPGRWCPGGATLIRGGR